MYDPDFTACKDYDNLKEQKGIFYWLFAQNYCNLWAVSQQLPRMAAEMSSFIIHCVVLLQRSKQSSELPTQAQL